ncbi:hypothetical protein V2J09_018633 [Rumex salicifolius]
MASGFPFPPQQLASPQFPIPSSHNVHQEAQANSSQPMPSASLLVRHLPDAVPSDTLSRLFSHYGASAVRPGSGGRLRNCAFVDFKDEASALQAQRQFNGLRFLGKVLSVEKAGKHAHDTKHLESEADKHNLPPTVEDNLISSGQHERSKSGSLPSAEPIAENLGVDYPFPPHLEYSYPPPDGNILTNIVNALIVVPRFYTQVLHLMNKMNIPAPFRMALPTPPLPAAEALPPPPPPQIVDNTHATTLSSDDESEMETSDEEFDDGSQTRRKRIKREAIVGPAINKDVAHEAVGLKPATLVPKEIPIIKKKNSVLQIKIVPKKVQHEDRVESVPEEPNKPEELLDDKAFATVEEIEKQKLPPEEILSLPKFKNYAAGNPAPVLYIKNLAKDVIVDDIHYIFGSLYGSLEAARSGLHVRVLQEGRMRGQAFLTFPSIDLAHRALNLANGFVFKGKPMIIQFANPKDSNSSKGNYLDVPKSSCYTIAA